MGTLSEGEGSFGDVMMARMATRICVKNLPKEFDEEKLGRHFEEFGPLTDVKVMRTE